LTASNEEYRALYVNDPNIRIGSEKLQIFEDQAVLIPIIVAYSLSLPNELFKDWGRMQEFTGLTIDYGDNPPGEQQLTINGNPVNLGALSMKQFRIVTPIFTAVVPDAPYGTSLKDYLEDSPIAPGSYPALVEGYFVMLKFLRGSYWIHSWASAPREIARPYFSELLYQIEVRERDQQTKGLLAGSRARTIERFRPARSLGIYNKTLYKKNEINELSDEEQRRFTKYFTKE
jgi:hypothetical protein